MTTKVVTVTKEFGSGENAKTVSKNGSCVIAETAEDIVMLLQEDATTPIPKDASDADKKRIRERVLIYFNYASDLKERARLQGQINSENIDPDKATEKGFEQFNKNRAALGKSSVSKERYLELMAA